MFLYSVTDIRRCTLTLRSLVVAVAVSKQLLSLNVKLNVSGTEKVILQATAEPHLVTTDFSTANINSFNQNELEVVSQLSHFASKDSKSEIL